MAIIKAPNKEYNGISAGVTFINGIGETYSPHLMDWFREHGYKVETAASTKSTPAGKSAEWIQDDPKETWVPEEKPKPKRQARKRSGK